jgi:gas vesicle protein
LGFGVSVESLGGGVKMGDRDSGTRFGIGFLLGAAVGLGLAFLFTPKSGKETRVFLKDKFSSIPDSVRMRTTDPKKVYKETWKSRKGQPKVSPTYFK